MKFLLLNVVMLYIFDWPTFHAGLTITYSQAELQSSLLTTAFYTSSLVLLVVFALFNFSSRNGIGLWYTLLFTIGLLFVACLDGTGSTVVWGDYTTISHWLPLAVMLALNTCGLLLAAHSIDIASSPIYLALRRPIEIAGYLNLISIAAIPFVPLVFLAFWANIAFVIMIVSQVLTTLSWRTPNINPSEEAFHFSSLFSSVTSLVFLAATVITGIIIWYQSQQGDYSYSNFIFISSRTIYLILSFSLITTFIAHIVGIRRDHDNALQRELQTARRAAKASEDKLQAERDFSRMREMAIRHRQQLSSASHDIRQPLVSLQLTLDKLRRTSNVEQSDDYRQALTYIEQLAESFQPEDNNDDSGHEVTTKTAKEVLPINLLLQTIQQMFGPEAREKSTELRMVLTDMSAYVYPSSVMRIVSNLVANALTHTRSEKILLGCRRRGSAIRIDVCDQGEGLSQNEFEDMKDLHCKGDTSTGEGIGLATCAEIAATSGYQLSMVSTKQRGTCFSLLVPRYLAVEMGKPSH